MLCAIRVASRTQLARSFVPRVSAVRHSSGIKILDAGKAKESFYWAQEDEKLLKKMIENHPELNPDFAGVGGIDDGASVSDKVKIVFMKHGIPPVNKALINDIVELVEKS